MRAGDIFPFTISSRAKNDAMAFSILASLA